MKPTTKLLAIIVSASLTANAYSLTNPFTEGFANNNANWLNGSSISATWLSAGGVGNSGYVGAAGTIETGGFGPIVFRGNAASDASGDAFVGNWLAGGVTLFTAYVLHDAPVSLNFYVRLDAGAGNGASSNPIEVPTGVWTELSIPIIDSLGTNGVFQSYGAAGTNFGLIFSNIQNVQLALASTQDPSTVGQTYNIGLDDVSVVPEPSTVGLLGLGAALLAYRSFRRCKAGRTK
jgi:hypothetical protein